MGTSFGKKTAQNLDCIENNLLDVIMNLLAIYHEVTPLMIEMLPITPWEMFNMLCMGTRVTELKDILFKTSGKNFEFIQAGFNEKIYLADKHSKKVKTWKE